MLRSTKRAAAQQRVGDRGPLAAGVAPGNEEILPRERGAHVQALDDAVVERHHSVVEKAPQRLLVVEQISNRLPQRG